MTKIYCASCFELSHNITIAINEVNTNGRCSRCDSDAVMPVDIIYKQLRQQQAQKAAPVAQPQTTLRDKWRKHHEQKIQWLVQNGYNDIADWWDGFCIELRFVPFEAEPMLLFSNQNGEEQGVHIKACTVAIATK